MRDINLGDSDVQRPHAGRAGITDDIALQTGNRQPSFNLAVPDASAIQAIQHMAAQIGAAQMQQPSVSATFIAAAVTAATLSPPPADPALTLLPEVLGHEATVSSPAAATNHAALLKTQPKKREV